MRRLLFTLTLMVAAPLACDSADETPSVPCEGDACAPSVGTKQLGDSCEAVGECSSALCVQVEPTLGQGGKVCSADCSEGTCPSGWQCGSVGARRACLCARADEVCDQLDNDCDGVVDGPKADDACSSVHAGEVCERGQCTCLLRCGDRCVDPRRDPENCGTCGTACGGFGTCVDRQCACNAGASLCEGKCVVTENDARNCGVCGRECGAGEACYGGECGCRVATCGGRCVDTSTDRLNCSECGKTCAGDCLDSACQAQTLLTGLVNPDFLTAVGADLVWVNRGDGRVQSCPIADCNMTTVVTLETVSGAVTLAANDRYVFWGNSQELHRFDTTTRTLSTVATATNVAAIAVDDTSVFWRDSAKRTVLRCAVDGDCTAGVTTFASGLPAGGGLMLITNGNLYFAYVKGFLVDQPGYPLGPHYGVHVCPLSGCPSSPPPVFHARMRQGGSSVRRLAVADGRLYMMAGTGSFPAGVGGDLFRDSCPLTGCENETAMWVNDLQDFSFAEGNRIFWVEGIMDPLITKSYRILSCETREGIVDRKKVIECMSPTSPLPTAVPLPADPDEIVAASPRARLVARDGFIYFVEPGGTLRRVEKMP